MLFRRSLVSLLLCTTLGACGSITAAGIAKTIGSAASIAGQIAGIFSDAQKGGNWEADLTNLMQTAPGEVTTALSSLATKPVSSAATLKPTSAEPTSAATTADADLGSLIKSRADACRAKVGRDCLSHEMAALWLHNRSKYVGDVVLTRGGARFAAKAKASASKAGAAAPVVRAETPPGDGPSPGSSPAAVPGAGARS